MSRRSGGIVGVPEAPLRTAPPCLLVIAAVILLHAMSARDWYISCAGCVPPRHMRQVSSHCLTTFLSLPNRCIFMSSLGSRHLVSSNRFVRCSTRVEVRMSPVSTSFRSIPSPIIPSTLVLVGPTSVGFRYSRESSVKLAIRSVLGRVFPITGNPGEGYLQVVTLRAHSGHMHSLPWLTRPYDYRAGSEIEGYAQHVGILDVEPSLLV